MPDAAPPDTAPTPAELIGARVPVPADAATGKVQVLTPGATLSSNVSFQVLP